MKGVYYTWSNRLVGSARVNSWTNRALINENWKLTWPNMVFELYLTRSSDHARLELKMYLITKPKWPFRFHNTWLDLGG